MYTTPILEKNKDALVKMILKIFTDEHYIQNLLCKKIKLFLCNSMCYFHLKTTFAVTRS